ncbi:DEAD/DEAH box helicase [Acidocella sp.]|uniref:DEAD/DEAH box helicase n=1 Tax=Acidocella sp. TaxID=50710 RepID=UPI002631EB94|nr:DEAD/DEAH box helicase [Acidocella sp.]
MPVPFSAEDFDRIFDSAIIRRAQSVLALGFVKDVALSGDTIEGVVEDMDGTRRVTTLTPERKGSRISFAERECSCGERGCRHLAATALAALAKFPALRKPAPASVIDSFIPIREPNHTPPPARPRPTGRRARPPATLLAVTPEAPEPGGTVLERPAVPVLRLRRVHGPDEFNRQRMIDVLTLDFDYGGVRVDGADESPFIRVRSGGQIAFIRRDPAAEAAALDLLRPDGFVQMRVADGKSARGQRVLVFRGEEAAAKWHHFVAVRVPELTALGWHSQIDANFGPQMADQVGSLDMVVQDGEKGSFSLEFGIEIDGERHPLLPILENLLARGGIEAAQIVEGEIITSLEDGRVIKLPEDRIRRLLAVMGDLIEAAGRTAEKHLVLPVGAAATVLDLEEVLTTSWQNAADIEAYVERFRGEPEIIPVEVPAAFRGALRPYQQQGVDWLQHLASHGLGAFLADDMGLGKTAQTIAHICVEHAEGRLTSPALIVVPTSLVANWTAELRKFAPHLKIEVLHGMERHEKRKNLDEVQVVITTYTVLTRDIEFMRPLPWHMAVLDEAQAIKSPEARATRAVCQLKATHKICLSGTPIENNLDELWSQFAFLMPGLLGDRRGFTKRFRTPIEKNGDPEVRAQLIHRIQPFILRRTKQEVATELPPKHTILRRISLAPDQRALYETIRGTLYETVKEQMAERTLAQSRVIVLDALLKLRQACCDPRLVKLGNGRGTESSAKLDDLMEMVGELIPEGRRILVFSQFTSMLDLIKPRLAEAGISFVELRGDTRDRATPVRRFEAGEVPLFLISLKAGGRGLNLTSADTVIHYDPWWNPAVEAQASDRAHRIGQTKSVFVYKLIASDTVEERILELQQRKAELASIAFQEGGGLAFNAEDIDFLFGQAEQMEPEAEAA